MATVFPALSKTIEMVAFGGCAGLLAALPAWGADKIQFFYGPFEPTIYVEDLETFAETGEVAERFEFVANRLNDDQKGALREFLNAGYDVGPIPISQFTYSPLGERLLERVGQVIQTDNFLNGMKPMRAALLFAAADTEQGFTIINILRHFPQETIQLNFPLARQIVAENEKIFRQRDSIVEAIRAVAATQSVDLSDIPMNIDPLAPGPLTWTVATLEFQNPERPQPSVADIYYPASSTELSQSIPVVVISHGIASSRQTLSYIAEHLASHGYGVISLEHAETSAEKFVRFLWGQEGAPDPRELLLRPRDITAILDTLTAQQATDPALGRWNLNSVGLLGQSLGGYTVLAAGGAALNRPKLEDGCRSTLAERPSLNLSMLVQCRILELPSDTPLAVADSRVAAVMAMNPLTSHVFGESGFQHIQVPVMLVAATNDYFTPSLPEQIEPFNWLITEDKQLVVIENATHFSFLGGDDTRVLKLPDVFIGPDPLLAREPVQAISLSFFNRYLRHQTDAALFLNQTYVETFPRDPFRFSLMYERSD